MSEWTDISLSDACTTMKAGGTPSVGEPRFYGGEIPFVTIEDMTRAGRWIDRTEKTITEAGLHASAAWLVPPGHLLYSMYATLGRVTENVLPMATNQAIIAMMPDMRIVHKDFLYQLLVWMQPSIARLAAQTTQPNLSATVLRKVRLTIPGAQAQRLIAEILSTVDEAIEQTEALIAKTQQIKAGLMHDLFTRGVTPNGELRPPREEAPHLYKESPIGWIPKEWEVRMLDRMTTLMTNGFVGTATPYYSTAAYSVRYLYGNNVRPNRLDMSDALSVSRDFHERQGKSQLRPGDMLTVQSGHIGTSAVVPEGFGEANCHALIISRFKEGAIVPEFASHYLNTDMGMKRLSAIFVGSTILHINTSALKRFNVPYPKQLSEQTAIVERMQAITERIEEDRRRVGKLTELKSGLMHDLLTGRVRVPTNSSNDAEDADV